MSILEEALAKKFGQSSPQVQLSEPQEPAVSPLEQRLAEKFGTPAGDRAATNLATKANQVIGSEDLDDMLGFAAQQGFLDTYKGVKQIFGVDEEEMKRDQKKLERYLSHPDHGGKVMAAYTAGLIGDPVGWLIPGMKAKNMASATKAGLLFGSLSGATGYVPEDMTRIESTLYGAAGGGVLSPTLFKFNQTVMPSLEKAYGKTVVPFIEKRVLDPAKNRIKSSKLGDYGRYFIDDYGLPEAYVNARKNMRINHEEYASRFTNVLKKYENLSPEQDALLYRVLNGEDSKLPADLSLLTKESRKVVDDMGQEMVDLGLLDKKIYEKNKGKYLYRSYKKTAVPEAKKMNREAGVIKILGGEFMRRGNTKTISFDELQDFKKSGWTQTSGVDLKTRTVQVHRDWTKTEREQMGEIISASYGMAKTGQLMTNDLATFKFYDTLAKDASVSWDPSSVSKLDFARYGAPSGYVQVPKDKIAGNINRYGNLAGKYVPETVMKDLRAADRFKVWRGSGIGQINHKMNQWWKRTKTTLNPTVHMNNTIANTKHYDMADGDWAMLRKGVSEMRKKTGDYELANRLGVFNADLNKNELGQSVNNYLRKYLAKGIDNTEEPNWLNKAWNKTQAFMEWSKNTPLDKLYGAEDNVFRLGLFKTRLAAGDTPEDAAKYARKWMIDYEIHAPAIKALRELPLPFISYSYRAAPLLAEVAYKKPWKIAKWSAILYGANQIGIDVNEDDLEKERRLLDETTEANRLYGFSFMPSTQIKIPREDKSQYLDVNRWYPMGDIFETSNQSFAIPFIPQPLQPSGGAAGGLAKSIVGFDTFTGKFAPGVGSGIFSREVEGRAGLFFKEFFPFVNQYNRIEASMADGLHPTKDDYTFSEAVLNSIGIKVKTLDDKKLRQRTGYKYKNRISTLKRKVNQLKADFRGGRISREDFDAEAKSLEADIREITNEAKDALKY